MSGGEARAKAIADEGDEGVRSELRLRAPFFGTAAGVGEDYAGATFCADAADVGIPDEAAYVVDDFGAGGQGCAGGGGFVRIYRNDRAWARAGDAFEHGEKARP